MTLKEHLDGLIKARFESGNASDHLLEAIENMKADGMDTWKASQALILAAYANMHAEDFQGMQPFIRFVEDLNNRSKEIYKD